jgi:putative transposase
MARISRVVASGHPHHVTQRGARSIPVFQTDSDRRAYLDFMTEELDRFGIEVPAWCLMTNHTHLIVVPKDSKVMARAIGEAHRRYARLKNFSDGVRGYLFQGRFGSCVLDERHLLAAARYVELNPVNAGIVKEAADYPWSSARFHLGLSQGDALVRDKPYWDWLTIGANTSRERLNGKMLGFTKPPRLDSNSGMNYRHTTR